MWASHTLGFTLLSVTLVLWIASSVMVQAIFGASVQFRKPVFLTLFNSATSVVLLLPRIADAKTGIIATLAPVASLSATAGAVWLCSQLVFNLSLLHTSVATNTVLSSTSSMFTLIFSLCIFHDPFLWRTFGAAVLSCFGCAVVASQAPQNLQADAVTTSSFGDALALSSAALFALASVLLRKLAPSELDMSSYIGTNGLISLLLAPVMLYAAHTWGFEEFNMPGVRILGALALNAVVGCSLANYLYSRALMLLSPVVANMYMSLSIPCSAFTDELLLGQHRFSFAWAVGASMACVAVVCAAFDLEVSDEDLRMTASHHELDSLLGSMDEDFEECSHT